MNNRFIVVVPFWNAEKWIGKSLTSLKLQEYKNFKCIVANDCSTDKSVEVAKKAIGDDKRFEIVTTKENLGPLGNAYEAAMIHANPEKEDVVVILDGDDFLFSKDVLSILNEAYGDTDCWMTYGSYINLSNKTRGKFSKQIPQQIIDNNSYREYEWCTSHLRTYKIKLLQKINKEDLLNEEGDYIKAAGDLALMFPLLEMSGHHSRYINQIMYIWNDLNEMNEHKTKRIEQLECEIKIRSMKPYDPLKEC